MGTFTYSPEINSALTYSGPGNGGFSGLSAEVNTGLFNSGDTNSGFDNLGSGNLGLGAGNSGPFNVGFRNNGNGNIGFGNSGDDIAPAMRQLAQAMAGFGVTNGALDTSSPLGQHNASPAIGMLFAAAGQSHP